MAKTPKKTVQKAPKKSPVPKQEPVVTNEIEIMEVEDDLTQFDEVSYNKGIETTDVLTYTKDRVILYGVNVSVFRACASLLDGLSPVRRRLLYTMYAEVPRLLPTDDYHKVAEWLYGVTKYHPHGTLSIENTFESVIKEWETNACLIDVSGNSGSLTGDGSAAVRYLDARMSLYAYKCFFEEFDPESVEMMDNYLQSAKEPVVLPAKYPNFLLGVAIGIAWGNSINLLPFNLIEAFELTKALIKEPQMTNVHLFPDSPRGYDVIDDGTIQQICDDGHGSIKIRAVLKPMVDKHGTNFIEITGFPEGMTQDEVERKIVKLIKEKRILGVADTSDKSDLNSVKLRLVLKPGVDPQQVIHQLYRNKSSKLIGHADLELNFAERTSMLHLGLKDAILEWVERRIDYKQRYYARKLSKLDERQHQLEGILAVMSENDFLRAARVLRQAVSEEAGIQDVMNRFHVSSYQAKRICDLTLSSLNESRRQKIQEELETIPKEIKKIMNLISSRDFLEDQICKELDEGIALFGKPRVCRIVKEDEIESTYVMKYRLAITTTHIKKMAIGGKGLGLTAADELVAYYSEVPEEDKIFLVTEAGRLYPIDLEMIPATDAAHRGVNIFEYLGVSSKVVKVLRISKETEELIDEYSLVFFTRGGIVKMTPLSEYITARTGTAGIALDEGDSVCYVMVYRKGVSTDTPLVYTKQGVGSTIDMQYVTSTGRTTRGTQHLELDQGDEVCGVCDSDSDELCVITNKGYGKRCRYDEMFKAKKRKDLMVRITSLHEGDTVMKIVPLQKDMEFSVTVILTDGSKTEVFADDIPMTTRVSKGERLVKPKRGTNIARLKINLM